MTKATKSSGASRAAAEAPPIEKATTGRITEIIRSRACGFIRSADGQRVFFHVSDLHGTTLDELSDRLNVRFNLVPDAVSGPRAVRVQVDKRAPRAARPAAKAASRRTARPLARASRK